jgi:hypothetical protein
VTPPSFWIGGGALQLAFNLASTPFLALLRDSA